MRKLKHLIHVSLDGYAAAADGSFEWIPYNDEIEKHAHALIHDTTDAVLWGRNTFLGMASYWPQVPEIPDASPAEQNHARWLNDATKYVVSTTLGEANVSWQNTLLLGENFVDEVAKLKQQPGKDMIIMGSLSLAQALRQHGLIDEFHINVGPTVLGGGTPLFGAGETLSLNLLDAKPLKGGVVALHYAKA